MTEPEYRQLVIPLRRQMYGVSLRMGLQPDDAADVVQETLIRLWRHRAGVPIALGECRLYCMGALRNEVLTFLRRRRLTSGLEDARQEMSEMFDSVDADAEFHDTARRIEVLIGRLPAAQAEAIRLSGFGGFDNSEIASAMGQTEGNVRQLLSRGRRKLREMMGEIRIKD